MKPRITPTGHEVALTDDDIIVSKTDLTGRITYANRTFMRIASYDERQLLGIQHNIVRHPDMPRGAFQLLWDSLKSGREFFAYVLNMTAEGHGYWVFANVTPDRDANGQVVGYFSVRRKPRTAALDVIRPIYRKMLHIERQAGAARATEASIAYVQDTLRELGTDYDRFILSI